MKKRRDGPERIVRSDVSAVDPPRWRRVNDGSADGTGRPDHDLGVGRMVITPAERAGRTGMVIASHFATPEAMEAMLAKGQEEGVVRAIGRIEGILAGFAS